MTITLHLSDEQMTRLKREAEAEGLSVEEHAVRKLVPADATADEFDAAAEYVLGKNAELYRRLAK